MSADETDLRRLLDANDVDFERLLARTEAASTRQPAAAAALAQATAEFAWFHHTGRFASPPLEDLVRRLGGRLAPLGPARGGRTIHVATQMYQTGGSTQAVASWTDEASHRAHEIVLTAQRGTPVPTKIRDRLGDGRNDRVRLTRLDTRPGGLLQRAAHLRRIVASADLVFLHTHPHDVVPGLAFARREGLPTIVYVDHADHVFWLGITAADHVMHMRDSGQALALTRRGLSPGRSLVHNRPLAVRQRTMTREAAKALWSISPDEVLVVTAADGSKFEATKGPSLADLVEPALRQRPELRWRIAGASPDVEPWASLARRTGGRAQALGPLPDMSTLHQAADVYLDSFPFASLTSMLESGAYQNPLVTYRGHDPSCAVYGSDSPGVDDHMLRPAAPDELVAALLDLVDDPDARRRRGLATAEAVVASHTGPGWQRATEALYDLAPASSTLVHDVPRMTAPVDLLAASVQARNPFVRSAEETVLGQLGVLPPRDRLGGWLRARRSSDLPLTRLAPDWAVAAVRSRRTP